MLHGPPDRLWVSEAAIPVGRHRIALTLNQALRSRVLQIGQAMVPDYIVKIPRQVVLSTHPLSLVMISVAAGAGSSTHTLSVPPSTDRIYLAMNLVSSGTTSQLQDGPATFEPSFNGLQESYAGQSVPASGYHELYSGHASRSVAEPFLDYQQTAGKLYRAASHILAGLGIILPNTRLVMYVARVYFRNNLDAAFSSCICMFKKTPTKIKCHLSAISSEFRNPQKVRILTPKMTKVPESSF